MKYARKAREKPNELGSAAAEVDQVRIYHSRQGQLDA